MDNRSLYSCMSLCAGLIKFKERLTGLPIFSRVRFAKIRENRPTLTCSLHSLSSIVYARTRIHSRARCSRPVVGSLTLFLLEERSSSKFVLVNSRSKRSAVSHERLSLAPSHPTRSNTIREPLPDTFHSPPRTGESVPRFRIVPWTPWTGFLVSFCSRTRREFSIDRKSLDDSKRIRSVGINGAR